MRISVSTGLYYKKGYKEILDIISETSCNNIELFLNQAFIDVSIKELKNEISKRNLNIVSVHTPLDFIAFERKESENYWINKSMEIGKAFNAEVIVSHMTLGEYFDSNISSLDKLHRDNMIEFSNVKDIKVATENLPCYGGDSFLTEFDKLYDFVSENNINFTFDTTHCAVNDISIIKGFKKFKNYVRNIHISDFADGIEHKVLGEGNLPLKDFITELKKEKYEGLLTIELDFDNKKRNDIKDNNEAVKAIQKSIDFINNIA